MQLDARAPSGPIEKRWSEARFQSKLVNPANRRKYKVIVVGSKPRRRRSQPRSASSPWLQRVLLLLSGQPAPCAQHRGTGGINAAKNHQNDGDSVYRLFYDTVKGGDFARESNVYRLAELSVNIIDQCVAQACRFAREYSGLPAPEVSAA